MARRPPVTFQIARNRQLAEEGRRWCEACRRALVFSAFYWFGKSKTPKFSPYCKVCSTRLSKGYQHDPISRPWVNGRRKAKERGLTWTLTREQFSVLVVQPCYYCGGALPPKGVGLDRKDNALGYVLENVLPCCGLCNKVRNVFFSVEEMREIGSVIRRILDKRNGNS